MPEGEPLSRLKRSRGGAKDHVGKEHAAHPEDGGKHVERDEPLFEISTDKVDTEIPSQAAGVLKDVLVQEGQTVGINTVVARIEDGATAAAAPPPSPPAWPRRA